MTDGLSDTTTPGPADTPAAATEAAPGATDQPPVADGAPAQPGGTSDQPAGDDQPSFEGPFRLEDITDPEVRAQVELYNKQLQAGFTRKTQELAAERAKVQKLSDLMDRLGSEETRDEALGELLSDLGLEIVGDDDPAALDTAPGPDQAPHEGDPVMAEIAALKSQLQEMRDAEQLRQQTQQDAERTERVLAHVDDTLENYAEKRGLQELPDGERRGILALAATLDPLDGQLPNVEGAIAEWEGIVAAAVQAYVKSKDVAPTDAGGSSGQSLIDLRDPKTRLQRAEAVAERAYAQHA